MENRIILLSLGLVLASVAVGAPTVIPIEKGEHWWGGAWDLGGDMPLDDTSDYVMDLREGCKFQGNASLFTSDRGRGVWSDDPCCFTFARGQMSVEPTRGPVTFGTAGGTPADAAARVVAIARAAAFGSSARRSAAAAA